MKLSTVNYLADHLTGHLVNRGTPLERFRTSNINLLLLDCSLHLHFLIHTYIRDSLPALLIAETTAWVLIDLMPACESAFWQSARLHEPFVPAVSRFLRAVHAKR